MNERDLYTSVIAQVNPYIKEKMSEVDNIIAKTKSIPTIKTDINRFCKENNIQSVEVISKLRAMIEQEEGNQYSIVEEILDQIENSIQLGEER